MENHQLSRHFAKYTPTDIQILQFYHIYLYLLLYYFLIIHFVSVSPLSLEISHTLQRLIEEIRIHYSIEDQYDTADYISLKNSFFSVYQY